MHQHDEKVYDAVPAEDNVMFVRLPDGEPLWKRLLREERARAARIDAALRDVWGRRAAYLREQGRL